MRRFIHQISLIAFLLAGFYAQAQTWEYPTDVMLSGSGLVVNATCNQQDPKFGLPNYSTIITSTDLVRNNIILQIDPSDTCTLPDSFSVTMTITIDWTDSNNNVWHDFRTLHVTYNNRFYTKDSLQSYYTFLGGHIVNVTITSITATGISTPLPDCIRLVNEMILSRDYIIKCGNSVSDIQHQYLPDQDELLVTWVDYAVATGVSTQYMTGDEYDLEWTFYDDSSEVVRKYALSGISPYDDENFRNNATRVTVNNYSYQIPLLYERGYLMFRIRPVRIVGHGIRVPGLWSTGGSVTLANVLYHVSGHEPSLNWQAKTSFAEEGKRKSVVSYFDGASHNRQSVTKISSDDIAVVAETIYDWEGRPVANTLPAPTIEKLIKHFKKFNNNMANTSYSWHDLDTTGGCNPTPGVMNPDSGSSRYYSPKNPQRATGFNQYIPDAFGYPFNETQYTEDLTNRVRRSAGPGKDHRMGTDHVTTYYYGAPEQSELNRLFGAEVGLKSHYFKNSVVDANGQVSVTYQDMHGRTIATALAGFPIDTPIKLDTIPDFKGDTVLHDAILDTANNMIDGTSITCTKTFVATSASTYKFNYSLFPESLTFRTCDSSQFCFDCVYDLKIQITDDCGNNHMPGGHPFVVTDSNYSFSGTLPYYFDTLCSNDAPPIIDSFSINLPIGEYTVTKTLSIKRQAIDFYFDYWVRKDTCIKTFNDFYQDALSQLDLSGCQVTCVQCLQHLGDSATYCHNFLDAMVHRDSTRILTRLDSMNAYFAYVELKHDCDMICDSVSICEQKFDLMLHDMSPTGGQYASYLRDSVTGAVSADNDTTSIFFPGAGGVYTPHPLYSDPSIVYLNSNNQPDTIIADLNNDGELDTVLPNQLTVEQFVAFWKPSWAYALVKYHPEYCYYEFCNANSASNQYDEWLRQVSSYDTAVYYGLMNPLNMPFDSCGFGPNTAHTDPFFQTGEIGAPYLTQFENTLMNYGDTFSMWEIATFTLQCYGVSACVNCKLNYYWNSFRNMYLGKKKMLVDSVMQIWAVANCSPNSTPTSNRTNIYPVPTFGPGGSLHYWTKDQRFEIINNSTLPYPATYPPDSAAARAAATSMRDGSDEFTCKDYAVYWYRQLAECNMSWVDSVVIINELIAVCNSGLDANHPYGASSSRPGAHTANGNTTFEGALVWAGALLPDWNYNPSDSCTSFLITNPLPNSSTPMYYQTVQIDKPNPCSCAKINRAYSGYVASHFTGNFSEYLAQTPDHILISQEDIMILLKACDSSVCDILPHAVGLPYQFGCDMICANCFQVVDAYDHFLQRFPGVYTSPHYLTLMQSYMNSALGMNLTALEYFDFMHDSCHYTHFPTSDSVPCHAPVAKNDTVYLGSTQVGYIDVMANDQSNHTNGIAIIQHTTAGRDSVWNDEILYIPNSGYSTDHLDSLHYIICNTCNLISCDTATLFIHVSHSVTHYVPPTLPNDTITVCADSLFTLHPIAHAMDTDGSTISLTYAIVNGLDSVGVINSIVGNTVTATMYAYGTQTIIYTACNNDPQPLCSHGVIIVHVLNCHGGGTGFRHQTSAPSMPVSIVPESAPHGKHLPVSDHSLEDFVARLSVTLPGDMHNAAEYSVDISPSPVHRNVSSIRKSSFDILSAMHKAHVAHGGDYVIVSDRKKMNFIEARTRMNKYMAAKDHRLANINKGTRSPWERYADKSELSAVPRIAHISPGLQIVNPVKVKNDILHFKPKTIFDLKRPHIMVKISSSEPSARIAFESRRKAEAARAAMYRSLYLSAKSNEQRRQYEIESLKHSAQWRGDKHAINSPTLGQNTHKEIFQSNNNLSTTSNGSLQMHDAQFGDGVHTSSQSAGTFAATVGDGGPAGRNFDQGNSEPSISSGYNRKTKALLAIQSVSNTNARNVVSRFEALNPTPRSMYIPVSENPVGGKSNGGHNSQRHNYTGGDFNWCDSLRAAVDTFYNQYTGTQVNLYNFQFSLSQQLGYYMNFQQWKAELDSCGMPCSNLINCTTVNNVLQDFYTDYPQYATHAPMFVVIDYLQRHNASNGSYYTEQDWIALFSCCSLSYPTPDTSATFCDSLSAALASYNIQYPSGADIGTFTYTMDNHFGYSHYSNETNQWYTNDFSYWVSLFDSCGISCPHLADCTRIDSLLTKFKTDHPQYATSAPQFTWVNYLNQNDATGHSGWYSTSDWKGMLSCCGISYPLSDSLATFCDTVNAIITLYNAQYPNGSSMYTFNNSMGDVLGYMHISTLTGLWVSNDLSYWMSIASGCGISCPHIVNCSLVGSLMSAFETQNPQYATHAPPFLWVNYLNQNGGGNGDTYSFDEWNLLLSCCGISHPSADTLHSNCDSLAAVVAVFNSQYPSGGPLWQLTNTLGNSLGYNHYDSVAGMYIGNTDPYWFERIAACGLSCPNIVNCHLVDSLITRYNSIDTAHILSWSTYLNQNNAGNGNWYSDEQWRLLLACCNIQVPPVDSGTHSFCDSLNSAIQFYNAQHPNGGAIWDLANSIDQSLNYYNHYDSASGQYLYNDENYWFPKIIACGISCPHLVNCYKVDTLMNNFYSMYPSSYGSAPAFVWANYLNQSNAGDGYWYNQQQWQWLLSCCNVHIPAIDTVGSYCDSLQVAMSYYNERYPTGSSLWDFQSVMGSIMGWGYNDPLTGQWINHDIVYWLSALRNCNINCPTIVDCQAASDAMNSFVTAYPQYATHAPAFLWANYLNSAQAGTDPLGHGNWYDAGQWMAILQCCNISYPTPDTNIHTHCDSLNAVLSLMPPLLGYHGNDNYLNPFNGIFGYQHFDSASGMMVNNTLDYLFAQMQLCGINCNTLVNCDTLHQAVTDFYNTYSFDSIFPAVVVESYLSGRFFEMDHGLDLDSWQGIMNCCGITLNYNDTILNHCDTLFSINMALQQFQNQFDSCVPSWVFNFILTQGLPWAGLNYSQLCTSLTSCGMTCIPACPTVLYTNCDSLHSMYYMYQLVLAQNGMAGGTDTGTLEMIYHIMFGTDQPYGQIMAQLAICNGDTCPLVTISYSFLGQLFNSYNDACVPIPVFVGTMNDVSGQHHTYTEWCNLLTQCGDTCPHVCPDSTYHTSCDSVLMAFDAYERILGIYEIGDSVQFLSEIFTDIYGRPISAQEAYIMVLPCLLPCDSLMEAFSTMYTIDTSYHPCVPPLVVSTVFSLITELEMGFTAGQVYGLMEHCGFSPPDTCTGHQTHCDSLLQMYHLYRYVIDHFEVDDSTHFLEKLQESIFGTSTGYTAMMISLHNCDSTIGGTCDSSFAWAMQALQPMFAQYDSCVPATVLLTMVSNFYGHQVNYAQICQKSSYCGIPCPDTCHVHRPVTTCDSLVVINTMYQNILAGYTIPVEEDLMAELTYLYLGHPMELSSFDSALSRCDSMYICDSSFYHIYETFLPEINRHGGCIPASLQNIILSGIAMAYHHPLTFAQMCTKLNVCGTKCPVICPGDTSHVTPCDSLRLIQVIMGNMIDQNPAMDSFGAIYAVYKALFARTPIVNNMHSFDSLFALCDSAVIPGCDSVLLSDITFLQPLFAHYGPCMPAQVLIPLVSGFYGHPMTYAQICQKLAICGIPCPDTCTGHIPLSTRCDTLRLIDTLYRNIIATYNVYGGEDTVGLIGNLTKLYIHGDSMSLTKFDSLLGLCDTVHPDCSHTDTIQKQIQIFLQTHPGSLYTDQATFDTALYHYLDSVFAHYFGGSHRQAAPSQAKRSADPDANAGGGPEGFIHLPPDTTPPPPDTPVVIHRDWCSILVACGDTCPRVFGTSPLLCNRPLMPPVSSNYNDSCVMIEEAYAYINAADAYTSYMSNLYDNFVAAYIQKCLGAYRLENFDYDHPNGEYHYTLYYYDQAGNLVKTVPPKGVDLYHQNHTLVTRYRYNTLNQVIEQKTPDAGNSLFWYDRIGKMTFSQNAKQNPLNQWTYTHYDPLQRITEVGQINLGTTFTYAFMDQYIVLPETWYSSILNGSLQATQVTHTYYDYDTLHIGDTLNMAALMNEFKRNRISSATYSDTLDTLDIHHYDAASHYRYDVHGNVVTLVQENKKLRSIGHSMKRLDYEYDLVSGKVNKVLYQQGKADMFIHAYTYDADNRITDVITSPDSIIWDHDASYQYYHHGPLARMELGGRKVQGVDYAYTIQGWLKGANGDVLDSTRDMGHDGLPTGMNSIVGKDKVGFTLGYFKGDYQPIAWGTGGTLTPANSIEADYQNIGIRSLYNGNISHMATNIAQLGQPLEYRYHYDQLNRITAMDAFDGLGSVGSAMAWGNTMPMNDYKERVSYDPDGNILTYLRNGTTTSYNGNTHPVDMDNMSYSYDAATNRLNHVSDAVAATNYTEDIDNQAANNYQYDPTGNMTSDIAEGITAIDWNVYGKIKGIVKQNGEITTFAYDPSGSRIMKEISHTGDNLTKGTYYVRDATGNIISIYGWTNKDSLIVEDVPMYGSSRLGSRSPGLLVAVDSTLHPVDSTLTACSTCTSIGYAPGGYKAYELSNHLGNVLTTVSDRNLRVNGHREAEVMTASDYYPFGMVMPARRYGAFDSTYTTQDTSYPCVLCQNFDPGLPGWSGTDTAVHEFYAGGSMGVRLLTQWEGAYINFPTVPGVTYTMKLYVEFGDDYVIATEIHDSLGTSLLNWEYDYDGMAMPISYTFTATGYQSGLKITKVLNSPSDTIYVDSVFITANTAQITTVNHRVPKGDYRWGFNSKEKDNEIKGMDNSLDFGARMHDPRLGRWLSVDPEQHVSVGISPYVHSIDNPINAVDPSGKVVIFINGMHDGFTGAKSSYWGGVDDKFMSRFHDHNAIYKDGSSGGLFNLLVHHASPIYSDLNPRMRMYSGYKAGKQDAANLIASLRRDPNDPNRITESIKVVTHSMGTAYSRGYTAALTEYVDNYNKSHKDAPLTNFAIETQVDIAGFQGSVLPANKSIKNSYYMSGDADWVANGKGTDFKGRQLRKLSPSSDVPGATPIATDQGTTHSITDYGKDKYINQIPEGPVFGPMPPIKLDMTIKPEPIDNCKP